MLYLFPVTRHIASKASFYSDHALSMPENLEPCTQREGKIEMGEEVVSAEYMHG